MADILFIGLGVMGAPMAAHLASAGHAVTVTNRSPAKVDNWLQKHKGSALPHPIPPRLDLDAVILCVGNDNDVREWLTVKGLLPALKPGTLIIDHSTTSATLAEEMAARCAETGVYFCDVPVSGGEQGAINGQLSLMAGCDSAAYDTLVSLTAPYTKAIAHMGPPGCGQKTKMVNQICITGLVEALSEGILFAQKAGLDVDKVMQLVSQGAAGSWQLSNRYKTMLAGEYDHGFAVELMCKDLDICLDQAGKLGLELPVATLVSGYYRELMLAGHNRKDTSSLLLRLQELDAAKAED
ncbi:MAG TPA: 2-hydroxy-3-oxopropionate reductase [Oceanospirillales bacterium]|nr:2-hydroxy-3-oxopropionate reductase [Oceanospirillaceae bacterium]HBS41632.1 2-hydroxy-3-oxopropionate reductase [Oceanospirillales bacterium]